MRPLITTMACGALQCAGTSDGSAGAWIEPKRARTFLFPVQALSKVFWARFLQALQQASQADVLVRDPAETGIAGAGAAAVLDYLSCYTSSSWQRAPVSPKALSIPPVETYTAHLPPPAWRFIPIGFIGRHARPVLSSNLGSASDNRFSLGVAAPHHPMKQLHRTLSKLRRCLRDFPEDIRPHLTDPAEPSEIADIQAAIRFPLPATFAAFLSIHDAIMAMDVHNGLWVGGAPELVRSIQRGDYPQHVLHQGASIDIVPIATDGGGRVFLLSVTDDGVWRYDPARGTFSFVAPGFLAFLELVLQDFLHYQVADPHWKFLS